MGGGRSTFPFLFFFFFRTKPPERGVTGRDGTVQLQKKYITGAFFDSFGNAKKSTGEDE